MKVLKGLLLFVLHAGAVLGVQILLFRLLLEQEGTLRCVLLSLLLCLVDLFLSCLLLRERTISRTGQILLHFWDLFLVIPLLLLGLMGFASDGQGVAFGIAVLALDLLLIVERSVSYVLFREKREN